MATDETWAYAGKRETSKGTLADAWEEPDGQILLYKKTPGIIGQRYMVKVSREGERIVIHGKPEMLNDSVSTEKRQEWTAKSRMLEGRIAMQRKLERQGDEIRQACEPLRAMLFEARTRPERAALLAAILVEIGAS